MKRIGFEIPPWLKEMPALSLGVLILISIVSTSIQLGYSSRLSDASDALYNAAGLAIRNPVVEVSDVHLPVVRAVKPDFENDSLLSFMRRTSTIGGGDDPQQNFEVAADQARLILDLHPFRRLGVIPAEPAPVAFATHFFMHSGFIHLALTVLMLLLAAPVLEKLWGPRTLAMAMILFAVAGAGGYVVAHPESQRGLIGASSIVSGLVAAILIRFRDQEIDFFAWLAPVADLELRVPAFVLGIVWVAYEGLLRFVVPGDLPIGVDTAAGYSAHAAAFVTGATFALTVRKLGLENQTAQSAPGMSEAAAHLPRPNRRFDLDKVRQLRSEGGEEAAFAMVEEEAQANARNRDAVMLYWEMAIDLGLAESAAPVLVRLLEEELRRGADQTAVKVWKALYETLPSHRLSLATLMRLAPSIGKVDGSDGAVLALDQALDDPNEELTPAIAIAIARMSMEFDSRVAIKAARIALASQELSEKDRAELQLLTSALDTPQPEEEKKPENKAPPANVFFEESDRSAFGEVGDLSEMLDDSFPEGAVSEGVPSGLSREGVQIDLEGSGSSAIAFSRIRALAVAGVHGLGDKPIVILDLLVDGGGGERPLSVIRLRCNRFDPRKLVPKAPGAREALKALVRGIAKYAQADTLVDLTGKQPRSECVFESLDAYHEKILRPAAKNWA